MTVHNLEFLVKISWNHVSAHNLFWFCEIGAVKIFAVPSLSRTEQADGWEGLGNSKSVIQGGGMFMGS